MLLTLTTDDIAATGAELQTESDGISTYFYYREGEVYQLTHSREYSKIIVKGLTKSDNQTLFQGNISNISELIAILRRTKIL